MQELLKFEVSLFALKVLDDLYEEQQSIPKILGVIEYALTFNTVAQQKCLVVIKSILHFLYSFSSEIKKNFGLGLKIINYAFVVMESEELLPVAADLFTEASQKLPQGLLTPDFTQIAQKIFTICEKNIQEQAVESLITGLFHLTESLSDGEAVPGQRQLIVGFVKHNLSIFLNKGLDSSSQEQLRRIIKLLLATFASLDNHFSALQDGQIGRRFSSSGYSSQYVP